MLKWGEKKVPFPDDTLLSEQMCMQSHLKSLLEKFREKRVSLIYFLLYHIYKSIKSRKYQCQTNYSLVVAISHSHTGYK